MFGKITHLNFSSNTILTLIYFSALIDMLLLILHSFYISHSFPVEETQRTPSPSTLYRSFSFYLEYHVLSFYLIFFSFETHSSLRYLFLIYIPLAFYSSRVLTLPCNGFHLLIYISLCYISQLRTKIIAG